MHSGTPASFDEALRTFEDLERDMQLREWTVDGVHVWKLLRFEVFSNYWRPDGRGTSVPPATPVGKAQRLLRLFNPLVMRNPFFTSRRGIQRVVIPSPRKRFYRGGFVDPVSYRAWHGVREATSIVLDVQSRLDPHPLQRAPSNEFFAGATRLIGRFSRARGVAADRDRVRAIEERLGRKPGRPPLVERIGHVLRDFKTAAALYRAYFRWVRPDALYVVCSYGKEAPIAAAQTLGIRTAEFQHGSVGRGHMGYDFRGWKHVPYFPDRMLAFGPDWFADCDLPSNCRVEPVGAPAIADEVATARARVQRRASQLLVLSQWSQSRLLAAEIAEFRRRRPDWRVVVRPHPMEDAGKLRELYDGAEVDRDRSLAEQAAESTAVTGVSSTALLEALLTGCHVAIMRLDRGPDYYAHLVREGNAISVRGGGELADRVDGIPAGSARGYFAETVEDVVTRIEGAS